MTESIDKRWDRLDQNEYLKFDRVAVKRSRRPDLHAFLLLDELFPRDRDIIFAAEHDQIYLDAVNVDSLTDEQILELIRCGVMWDSFGECMYMYT